MHYALCTTQGAACYARQQAAAAVPSLSLEREQQFTYYWYAAKEAFDKEQEDRAKALFEFCHTLNPYDAHTLFSLSCIYMSQGQIEKGQACVKQAFEIAPETYWNAYCNLIYNDATLNNKTKNARCIAALKRATDANPQDEEALEILSSLYFRSEQYKKAIETVDRLGKIGGMNADRAAFKYIVYKEQKKNKQAQKVLEDYLAADPTQPTILKFYAEHLWHAHPRLNEATADKIEHCYELICQQIPDNAEILNDYAYFLATRKKKLKKAEEMSFHAISAEPANPAYLDTYAWILYLRGDISMARLYIKKALRAAPASYNTKELIKHYKIICK